MEKGPHLTLEPVPALKLATRVSLGETAQGSF